MYSAYSAYSIEHTADESDAIVASLYYNGAYIVGCETARSLGLVYYEERDSTAFLHLFAD